MAILAVWQVVAYQRAESYISDSTYYQVLAVNLLHGQGYQFNFKPHTQYPPGLPILLAGLGLFTSATYESFVRIMPVFGLVGLLSSYWLLRRAANGILASLACLSLATSPLFFQLSTQTVLSDLPYFAVSIAALVVYSQLEVSEGRSHRFAMGAAFCALVVLTVLVRSAGIALVVATGLAAVISMARGHRNHVVHWLAVAFLAGVVVEGGWLFWSQQRLAPDWPGEYANSYVRSVMMKDPHRPALGLVTGTDLISRIGSLSLAQMGHFAELVTRYPWIDVRWFSPPITLSLLLVGTGLASSIRRLCSPVLSWYTLAYVVLYSLWPFDERGRFILPIYPLLILFAWRGTLALQDFVFRYGQHPWVLSWVLAVVSTASAWSFSVSPARGVQARLSVAFWVAATMSSLLMGPDRVRRVLFNQGARGVIAAILLLAFGVSLVVGVVGQAKLSAANMRPDPRSFVHSASVEVAEWLRSRADDGVVMAQQVAILHRLTGRRVVSFPVTSDGHVIANAIRSHGVSYLVVHDSSDGDYFFPTESERFDELIAVGSVHSLVHSAPGFRIYRVQTP